MPHPTPGICLDAASVRTEIADAASEGGNPHNHSDTDITALLALSDNQINNAIHACADDAFWAAYDRVRSDAIDLLTAHLNDKD